MLAVLTSIRPSASAHAEFRVTDKAGPFMVLEVGSEGVTKDKSADGVPIAVCSNQTDVSAQIYDNKGTSLPEPWGSSSNGYS